MLNAHTGLTHTYQQPTATLTSLAPSSLLFRLHRTGGAHLCVRNAERVSESLSLVTTVTAHRRTELVGELAGEHRARADVGWRHWVPLGQNMCPYGRAHATVWYAREEGGGDLAET